MQHITAIEHFLAVMREGNFSKAARSLGLSNVAISKSIASLEASTGVRLFERSTRTVRPSAEAHLFFEQCQEPMQALQSAQRNLRGLAVNATGLVRVTCIKPFGKYFVIPALQSFLQHQRSVHVHLSLDDRPVDLIAEGFDLGIRATMAPPEQVIARDIAELPMVLCASPEYFVRHGVPHDAQALKEHQCLRMIFDQQMPQSGQDSSSDSTATKSFNWYLGDTASKTIKMPLQGNFTANDLTGLETAALSGMGIFQAPLPLVLPHFRSGSLRPILPETMLLGRRLVLHYRSRKNQPPRVKLLIEHLLETLRKHPDLCTDAEQLCKPYWLKA
jgi:DNA-binding transcriptional LysR family regulator